MTPQQYKIQIDEAQRTLYIKLKTIETDIKILKRAMDEIDAGNLTFDEHSILFQETRRILNNGNT